MTQEQHNFRKLIKKALPKLDETVLDYVVGTLEDSDPSDFGETEDSVYDYVSPFLLDADCSESAVQGLCVKLAQILLSTKKNNESVAKKLENGPLNMNLSNESSNAVFMPGMGAVDIAHAGSKFVQTRVDEKKLEKAELKLKAKMEKRKADVEVSFKILNKPPPPPPMTDQQIRDILEARGKNKDIHLVNFDLSHVGLRIVTNANLTLVYGRRYGLVGRNGIGKSTLMRAIARREINGMDKFKHISLGHVEQEIEGDHLSCVESVMKADVYREYLIREEKRLSKAVQAASEETVDISSFPEDENSVDKLQTKLKEVFQKMEDIEADKAEARASTILSGLGFSKEMQRQPTREFSGGWKMRLALARALFTRPDLLLLDEPTNHLDIPAVVWLSNYLLNWKSTLLVVSHDREFLDSIATDILHMHDEKLDSYRGNFSQFEGVRNERVRNSQKEYEAQMQYRQHLQDFVDRWRFNAKRAAQAQSKLKILQKLPEIEVPTEEISVQFSFPDPEKISPPILQCNEVTFGYNPEKLILQDVNIDVRMDSRVAVIGGNGTGKSTLLKLLTGAVEPKKGHVFRHGRLRFSFFSQHHVDQLEDLELTPVQFLEKNYPGFPEEEYRRHLGCFGISGRVGLQPLATLSGGQKSRVVFASMAIQRPGILVLDEPTNHLDYMSVDSLIDALKQFKGGVILVSHDQRFIDRVCNDNGELWVCENGRIRKFDGDSIAEYKKTLIIPE